MEMYRSGRNEADSKSCYPCTKTEYFSFGDVPKWSKGPHSKCGRGVKARESSNLSISAKALKGHTFKAFSFSIALIFSVKSCFQRLSAASESKTIVIQQYARRMHKWFHFGTIELKITYKMLYKWVPGYIKMGFPESAGNPSLLMFPTWHPLPVLPDDIRPEPVSCGPFGHLHTAR